ncbi:unnamed protein product [Rhizopus stolonifer]
MDLEKLKKHIPLIVPACLAISSLYYLSRSKPEKKGYREIPYPPHSTQWPIFGHMISLGDVPSKQITQWHKEAGSIYKINMGNQQWIMISDPLLAHDIFVKAGADTSSRPYHRFTTDIYGMNNKGVIFATYNNKWRNKRRTVSSILNPNSVDKFGQVLEAEVESLMDRLGDIADQGTLLDPFEQLQLTSMNIVLTVLAGTRYPNTDDPTFVAINQFVYRAMIYSGIAGDLGSFLPGMSLIDRLTGTEKRLRNFIENERDPVYKKIIKEAQESEKDSLIKDLTQMMEEGVIDKDDLIVMTGDLIAAGSDTVAVSLYWAFAILSERPEIQQKIIEELDAWETKHPGVVPCFNYRNEFPYSICVQKEVMRFRPITNFGIPHLASEDVSVNGYFIPKGTILISSMLAMHSNPDFYDKPEEFRPERFLNNTIRMGAAANAKIEDRDFFAFGWGRRICPGIHLAEIELFNFYVRFFSKYTIAPELDSQGNPVHINLNDYIDEGIVMKPVHYNIRILRRV